MGGRAIVCCAMVAACGSPEQPHFTQLEKGSPREKVKAALYLGTHGHSGAIPHLQLALQDTNAEVLASVIWSLGTLRSKSSLARLLPMLAHEDRDVRQAAAQALKKIEEPEAISVLEAALGKERDRWVARDISDAISHLRQFEGEVEVGEMRVKHSFF